MRLRLLDLLACPECGSGLCLEARRSEVISPQKGGPLDNRTTRRTCLHACAYEHNSLSGLDTSTVPDCSECYSLEVLDGVLTCNSCGDKYPIIDGIPRLLARAFRHRLIVDYSDFFQKYPDLIEACRPEDREAVDDEVLVKKERTANSFGYEWTSFPSAYSEIWRYNFLEYIRPIRPAFFPGKLVLDAGCGTGYHAYWSSQFGAETVAVDLSRAVETAWRTNRLMPTVHVIQADIYHLPLKAESFDFIYSIGVLHHLPDPERGFRALLRFLKSGGMIFAWVYGVRKGVLPKIAETLRGMTSNLPLPVVKVMSYSLAVGFRLFFHIPYRILSRVKATEQLARAIPAVELSKYPFPIVANNIFDTLSPPVVHFLREDSFLRWFERAGLQDVQIIERDTAYTSWRGLGIKRLSVPSEESLQRAKSIGWASRR